VQRQGESCSLRPNVSTKLTQTVSRTRMLLVLRSRLNATVVSNGEQLLNQSNIIRTGSSSPPVTFFLFCRPAPSSEQGLRACSTACASCCKDSLIYRPEFPGFFSTKKIHLYINSNLLLKSAMIESWCHLAYLQWEILSYLERTSILLFSQMKEILAAWKITSLFNLMGN
jgi:hypothetical protein